MYESSPMQAGAQVNQAEAVELPMLQAHSNDLARNVQWLEDTLKGIQETLDRIGVYSMPEKSSGLLTGSTPPPPTSSPTTFSVIQHHIESLRMVASSLAREARRLERLG